MARQGILARLWRRRSAPLNGLQRLALVLVIGGVVAALGIVGLLAFRQSQNKFFMDVTAVVAGLEEHCDVAGKTQSGSYETVTSMDCAATEGFVSTNAGREFRVTRAGIVTLSYEASGLVQQVKLPFSALEPNQLVRGGKVQIYVNPNRLNDVKTDVTWADLVRSLLFMTGSVVVALLGMILFRLAAPAPQRPRRRMREAPEFDDGIHDDEDEGGESVPNAFHEDEDLFEPPRSFR